MRIGLMRQKVTIQKPLSSDDSMGGEGFDGWQDIAEAWANVMPSRADIRYQAAAVNEAISHLVTIRWTQTVWNQLEVGCRVVYNRHSGGGKVFLEVRSFNDARERRREIVLECQEVRE